MRKILSLFVSVVALLGIIICFPIKNATAESDTAPLVSISNSDEYANSQYAYPDDNNYVWFNINITGNVNSNVVVYYRTYDISAVSKTGDYSSTYGEVVFSPNSSKSVLRAVQASKTSFGIDDGEGPIITRCFGIEIYKVDGNATISEQNSINCMLGYDSVRKINNFGDHYASSRYLDYDTFHESAPITSAEIDHKGSWAKLVDFTADPTYNYWYANYIATEEAELYANFDGLIDDWGCHFDSTYTELKDADGNVIIGLKCHGWFDDHRLAPNLKHHEDYSSWYEDVYTDTGSKLKYFEPISCSCGKCFSYSSYFYRVEGKPKYTLKFSSDGGYDRLIKDVKIYSTLIDGKAPVIEEVFTDQKYCKEKKVLRFNVRFSERIHLDYSTYIPDVSLSVKIGNQTKQIPLVDYEHTKGTDTLCFEIPIAELNHDGFIENVQVMGINNAYHICDYGGAKEAEKNGIIIFLNNRFSNTNLKYGEFEFSIDSRVPEIQLTPNTEGPQRQHAVTVGVADIYAPGVTLYYTWTNSKETPTEYDNFTTIENGTKMITQGGLTGQYYLHVKAVTEMGNSSTACLEQPLQFDNSPPEVNVSWEGDYKERVFEINVEDYYSDSSGGLSEIYMIYRNKGELDYKTKLIWTATSKRFKYSLDYTVRATDVGVGENETKEIEIGFYAVDKNGNYIEDFDSLCESMIFDTRKIFNSEFIGVDAGSDAQVLLVDGNKIIVKKNTTDVILNFENIDQATYLNLTPYLKDATLVATQEAAIVGSSSDGTNISLIFNEDVGYYKVTFKVDSALEEIHSQEYYIYIATGEEETLNYSNLSNQYVLNNYVYQLSTEYPDFYYLDTSGALIQKPYATAVNPASFTNQTIAYNYIFYQELSDLYAVRLNNDLATYLNSSITSYVKAPGETTVAKEGQIWIRYKTPNWNYKLSNNSWVYYCYSESTYNPSTFSIDIIDSSLPPLLYEAISTVSSYICSLGSYNYLVGSENIDKYGAPKLLPTQIFTEELQMTSSLCGTKFKSPAVYFGDEKMKQSIVRVNNENHILATNYLLLSSPTTSIYYRRANTNEAYTRGVIGTETTYSSMIGANGIFEILEASADGIRIYFIYIDKEAPLINLKWYDSNDVSNTLTLSSEHGGMYINATKASIQHMTREADDLAYVLLYRTSSKKLLQIITKDMLEDEIQLPDDHYSMYIYDRSGNYYIIYFRIDSSELECNVVEVPNEYFKINTNRDQSQIKSFEVYCNNELVTNVYSNSLKLTKAGIYKVIIVDWYGNEKVIDFEFSYDIPVVTWRYEKDGQVYVYNQDTQEMTIQSLGKYNFFVISKCILQFSIDGPYSYEFIGDVPEHTYSAINKRIRLKDAVPFTVKIYYYDQPDIYVIYNVSYDNTAPEIEASYLKNQYEATEVQELLNKATNMEVGAMLVPDSIEYSVKNINYQKIDNGDVFFSELVSVDVYDSVGVYEVYVYLDGKLILKLDYDEISTIILSRKGNYRIVVYDVLGNEGSLEFINVVQDDHEFMVDENVDELTGNTDAVLNLEVDADLHYLVSDGTNKYYLGLSVTSGTIYQTYYYVGLDSLNNKTLYIDNSTILFSIDETTTVDTYYEIYSDCCKYSVKYDDFGKFTIKLEIPDDDKVYQIQTRIEAKNEQMYFYEYKLSKMYSNIDILDYKNNVVSNSDYIYLSKNFSIDELSIGEEVVEIRLYYSLVNSFDSFICIYDVNGLVSGKYSVDGFYKLEVINIYNNITYYNIVMSNSFTVTAEAIFADGEKVGYSNNYNDVIKSNKKINLYAYSSGVEVIAYKDNVLYNAYVKNMDSHYVISLEDVGEYEITIIDHYGNEKQYSASIKVSQLTFDEALIYGYNEDALLKEQGYTNTKLSINAEVLIANNIAQVNVIHNDKVNVIYDVLNENTKNNVNFNECIGYDKDPGLYKVVFRDAYGNIVTKDIYYNDIPTLELSRTTRNATTTIYDIDVANKDGFWSNMSLHFNSTSKHYIFMINDVKYSCPKTLSFDLDLVEGDKAYTVSYVDEYGFKYEFNAYLSRKEIALNIENTDYKIIDEVITVKEAIKIVYDEGTVITYTIDSLNRKVYEGEELIVDGVYRFEAVDLAGNIAALTVRKDTFVYYDFYESSLGKTVINGGIVNTNRVVFRHTNDDSSYIEKAYHNGKLVKSHDGIFSDNGYWEFVISDEMDNKSFFSFYIVTNKLSKFDYKTPQHYIIEEVLFDSGDGIKNSYIEYVHQYDNYSHIIVEENGSYQVKMISSLTGEIKVFTFVIDKTKPVIILEGVAEGGNTINDVTISGYNVGDTIYIYRDGKLIKTIKITSSATEVPVIDEGGNYEIVVESEASVQSSVSFTRAHIPNTASSILIIITLLALVGALFGGLVFRNRLKVDE